jgi:hypothetical protein
MFSELVERGLQRRLAIGGVGCHCPQGIDRHRNSAREERRLKQLR